MYVSYNGKCFVEQIQKTLQITVKKLPEVTLLLNEKKYIILNLISLVNLVFTLAVLQHHLHLEKQ